MRIVAISDFDSGFSASKTIPRIKREKPDIIIAHGDLCYGERMRKILFEHWDEIQTTDKSWYDFVPKKKAKELIKRSLDQGERVVKSLNSLGVPVLVVYGNHEAWDYKEKAGLGYYKKRFDRIIKKYKNVVSLEFASAEINGINFVGYGNFNSGPEYRKPSINSTILTRVLLQKYKPLFSRELPNVLITHNVPYGTKLDIVNNPDSPRNGQHVGSKYARKLISKYKPSLCISGHMHENQGKFNLKKTLCINTGMGSKGQYAVIILKKDKVKVMFRK